MSSNDQQDGRGILGSIISSIRSTSSNDQQDGRGILGSIISFIHRKCSEFSKKMLLKGGDSQYIWEIESGHEYSVRIVYYGWVLERKGWTSNYRLRNPTTQRVLNLPDPKVKPPTHMIPRYLPSRKTFKMVFPIPNHENGNLSFKVLTIGEDSAWRTLDFPSVCKLTNAKWLTEVDIEGAYVMVVLPEHGEPATIACLEIESEMLRSIIIPQEIISNDIELVNWAEKPALVRKLHDDCLLHVWIVEDYENQIWAEEKIDLTSMKDARKRYTPYYFNGRSIWMHHNLERYLTFDIASKVITYIDGPRKRGRKTFCLCQPNLEDLEGSKPLKE